MKVMIALKLCNIMNVSISRMMKKDNHRTLYRMEGI